MFSNYLRKRFNYVSATEYAEKNEKNQIDYVIPPFLEVLQVLGPLAKSTEAASQHYTNHPALKSCFPSAKNNRKFAPHHGCSEENLVDCSIVGCS
jgi:hypothetical protein